MTKLEVKLRAFDFKLVDEAAKSVLVIARAAGVKVSGPVPLPTKRELFTILRSVHINKKSREQFESRTHKRLIIIESATKELLDKIKRLELPAGVEITTASK